MRVLHYSPPLNEVRPTVQGGFHAGAAGAATEVPWHGSRPFNLSGITPEGELHSISKQSPFLLVSNPVLLGCDNLQSKIHHHTYPRISGSIGNLVQPAS